MTMIVTTIVFPDLWENNEGMFPTRVLLSHEVFYDVTEKKTNFEFFLCSKRWRTFLFPLRGQDIGEKVNHKYWFITLLDWFVNVPATWFYIGGKQ